MRKALVIILLLTSQSGCSMFSFMSWTRSKSDKSSGVLQKDEISKVSELNNDDWQNQASSEGRGINKKGNEEIKPFDDFLTSDQARSIEKNLGY